MKAIHHSVAARLSLTHRPLRGRWGWLLLWLPLVLAGVIARVAGQPASLGSGGYSQDFSSFVSAESLPGEWQVSASGADANKLAHSLWGASGTGIKFSGGVPLVNVLGYQHTENTDVVTKTLTLRNDTGSVLTDLVVSYLGRLGRPDSGRNPFYEVVVAGVPVPALRYSTADGDGVRRHAAVGGLGIPAGDTFTIVWQSNGDQAPGTTTRRQIGISQLVVQAGTAVFPPSLAGLAVVPGSVTVDSASVSAMVQADGGAAVAQRGFVYALTAENPLPELGGTGVVSATDGSAGTGPMTALLGGLEDGTSYTVRAFAGNSVGISYSLPLVFTTVMVPPALVSTYAEGFNGFSGVASLPKGWSAVSSTGFQSYAGAWTSGSASGGFYGGVSNPGVLGYLHTGDTGNLTVSLTLRNMTGAPLTSLQVSYLGRVERSGNNRSPEWVVSVAGVVVPELAYSTALGSDQSRSHLVTGLNVAAGESFAITWVSSRGSGTGASKRIGVADVVVSVPPSGGGSGYDGWKSVVGGQGPREDFDADGLPNGMEYFMGTAGNAFTSRPGIEGGRLVWPRNPAAQVSAFRVEVSSDLVGWKDASIDYPANVQVLPDRIEFTLPDVPGSFFARLSVTP